MQHYNLSEGYKKQLDTLHKKNKMGKNSKRKNPKLFEIPKFLEKYNPTTILDYGCGSGSVVDFLSKTYTLVEGYDPCVQRFSTYPNKIYDVLISMDVLEHIEPNYLDINLKEIDNLFSKAAYLDIHTSASPTFLPDGRNAHLIQEQPEFWRTKIEYNMNIRIVEEFWREPVKKGAKILNYVFIIEKK